MELLHSLELAYTIWNLATEVILSKIKGSEISEIDYVHTIKNTM
jgi:hypothetical protein